ncbi:serpin E3 isoform X2 [Sphaerodactylus townsendi]|uniref:serpin E3 isoform X2 n=1 Tax=Sphaerodactylus townsendi TaxID=933632 RepID=UPI0020266163|nr:serpin E3 isoform X2 [Sphaerodactylus townsendi]
MIPDYPFQCSLMTKTPFRYILKKGRDLDLNTGTQQNDSTKQLHLSYGVTTQHSAFMWPPFIPALLWSFCSLNVGSCEKNEDPKPLKAEFAFTLYQGVAELENGTDLLISPASISLALGLLRLGAQGNTFAQLERALGYNSHDQGVPTLHKDGTNSSRETVAQLACALFIQTGRSLSPQFIQYAAIWANDTVRHTNFSEPNRTTAQINEWIAANTGDGEPNSLSLQAIDSPFNQIALVSTMYFKSTWQRKFTFTHTQALTFTTADGFILKVPTMYLSAEVNYGEFMTDHLEWISVVELPYLGEHVSMFVILPSDKRTSLAQTERYLTAKTFSVWSNSLRRTKMDIFLPRFRIQNHLDLKMVLPALGITDMFDPVVADFTGISEQGSLFISEAIHKAKIEVTEDGTKASGATAMVLLKRSRAAVFKADRPFNFLLRQASTGSILFIGRLTNPTE